jgi:putative flippase GtrA
MKDTQQEILRFTLAGVVVVLTDFGIYYLLIKFLPYSAAKATSFTCAGIVGYLLNKYLVFKNNQTSVAEMAKFIFINLLALGVNVLINQTLLQSFQSPVWLALMTATAVTNVMIFVSFKWWVFKK